MNHNMVEMNHNVSDLRRLLEEHMRLLTAAAAANRSAEGSHSGVARVREEKAGLAQGFNSQCCGSGGGRPRSGRVGRT